MSLVIAVWCIWASPDSVLGELSRGMLVFCRVNSGAGADDYEQTINPPLRIYLEKELFSIVFKGKIWKKSQKGVYLQCKKSQKGV